MRKETEDGESLIFCVNHACGSNGGTNFSAYHFPNRDILEKLKDLIEEQSRTDKT